MVCPDQDSGDVPLAVVTQQQLHQRATLVMLLQVLGSPAAATTRLRQHNTGGKASKQLRGRLMQIYRQQLLAAAAALERLQ